MASTLPVLISGAGPTGLALACDLARRGVAFRIIDQAPAYFNGSRGKGLQPRTLEVLEDFGIADEIVAHGRFHLPFRGYDGYTVLGDRDMHEGKHSTPSTPYASPLLIPQWRVEQILRGCLARIPGAPAVELSTRLVSFTQDADGVTATLENSDQARVQYLVGCDGGHSLVRHQLGLSFLGETFESQRMLLGDVEASGLDRDHWHVWQGSPEGPVMLCPLPSTNAFQFQAVVLHADPIEPSLEEFQATFNRRSGRTDIVLSNPTWMSMYRANVRMVDRYSVGRVFIAGDAAHVHSPAGGQGMNTGIQDAYNLGWKLAAVVKDGAPASLLDTYNEERLPVAKWLLDSTSKLHKRAFQGQEDGAKRDPEFLQLTLGYRESSLSNKSKVEGAMLQPGDRAPDAPCTRISDGTPVRLFDLFRGPQFTALAFGRKVDGVNCYVVGKDIADTDGHIAAAYGDVPAGTVILIRPDGYIATVADGETAVDWLLATLTATADEASREHHSAQQ